MSALKTQIPTQSARMLKTRVLAADATITITAEGRLSGAGIIRLMAELAEGLELCCGVVVLDVTACQCEGNAVVSVIHEAIVQAAPARCSVRVVTADVDVAIALDRAEIARTMRS
ncbi:hypothetical protein AB5J62_13100 [Amycolatopsis sp. cg5]|uniref:hypothetical protein n=1 Tax=Amycolatopsis sp. cg5 TaxID=3238802 RepID=UPI00352415B6